MAEGKLFIISKFKLNKFNEIKDYFIKAICEKEAMSKGLSRYMPAFDYFNKVLIVLSGTKYCYWCTSRNNKCNF